MIYLSAMLSFSAGRHYDGIGQKRNCLVSCWLSGKLTDSVYQCRADGNFISKCSRRYEGKNFAVRNAVQFSSIPLGILLGGLLADYVFEPFMLTQNPDYAGFT